MQRTLPFGWLLTAALLASAGIVLLAHRPPVRRALAMRSASPALNTIRFEDNRGQADPEARFIARGGGAPMLLGSASLRTGSVGPDGRAVAVEMRLVGADPSAEGTGLEPLELKTSYYVGSDPARWRSGIPSFRKVRFDDVYPGIDLLYYGASQPGAKLEYDFVVEPGADPDRIELEIDGYDEISLDAAGGLRLRSAAGELRQLAPLIYQPSQEGRQEVDGRFVLAAAGRVRFALGDYDRSRTLVIDPGFEYSTYFGGNDNDQAFDIAVDSQGNAYITGWTQSTTLPTTNGAPQTSLRGLRDAFTASINPDGRALLYATYFGGSARDQAWNISIDRDGNAYITGWTDSPDFPTTDGSGPAGGLDSFVAVFDPSGSLRFSTRRGGSQDDEGLSIDVLEGGDGVLVASGGRTVSRNFPVTPDAFQGEYGGGPSDGYVDVLRLDPTSGTTFVPDQRATSYQGGEELDIVDSIALGDFSINVGLREEVPFWVSSTTSSDGLFTSDQAPQPERGGGTDGYVTALRLDPTFGDTFSSGPVFGSYVGGSGDEWETAVDLSRNGDIITFSSTESSDFPTTPGVFMTDNPGGRQSLALTVTRNDPDTGETSRIGSYYGGGDYDQGPGLALDPNGSPVISGYTFSTNLPTTPDAPQPQFPGGSIAGFVARLYDDLSGIDFATYLGGPNSNAPNVTVDPFGQIYIVGIGMEVWPTTPGSVQEEFGGLPFDATVTKLGGPFLPRLGLVNAGSFLQGAGGGFSPQEIVTQFGTKVGPPDPAGLTIGPDGKVTRELGGTRVNVNGDDDIVAMIYSFINQTSYAFPGAIDPIQTFLHPALAQPFAEIRFDVDGVLSNTLRVPIVESNPGIFALNSTGQGQGAILNPDFSVNGPDNPAPSDGYIIVYGTGGGIVDPICPDATLAPRVEPLPRLMLPQRATIDGVEAQVLYGGSAPDLICGVNQWNLAPTNQPSGTAVPIQICSGEDCSQEGITAAFQ